MRVSLVMTGRGGVDDILAGSQLAGRQVPMTGTMTGKTRISAMTTWYSRAASSRTGATDAGETSAAAAYNLRNPIAADRPAIMVSAGVPGMSRVQWSSGRQGAEDFRIEGGARPVTGALWLPPACESATPMVLCGHGASGDRYQAPIPHLARRLVGERGVAVLAIDGPVHGLRQVGPGGRQAFVAEMGRPTFIDDMVGDWLLAHREIGAARAVGAGPLGYFGLSMGTIFGVPLLASDLDFAVSVIGLCGVTGAAAGIGARLLADAAVIDHPLLFLMQLEDELFDRDGYLALFDGLRSVDKRLHANPGQHSAVPAEEVDFAFDFLVDRLAGSGHQSNRT
jgi:hypothetical protein